ncbi:hypothetical protein ACQKND_04415 [Viridibacillus arvi]|uniref:hypothetical protein n=1 Tax=Viridibacillus arvi TaxID=263475 RepID=UPI003CFF1C44
MLEDQNQQILYRNKATLHRIMPIISKIYCTKENEPFSKCLIIKHEKERDEVFLSTEELSKVERVLIEKFGRLDIENVEKAYEKFSTGHLDQFVER